MEKNMQSAMSEWNQLEMFQRLIIPFISDDGNRDSVQNIGNSVHTDTADHPRRLYSVSMKSPNLIWNKMHWQVM
jgi:hypothetical protein